MSKGFGKEPVDKEIVVESMVASRSLTPAVLLTWGKQQAQLDPATARHHAFSVLVAIAFPKKKLSQGTRKIMAQSVLQGILNVERGNVRHADPNGSYPRCVPKVGRSGASICERCNTPISLLRACPSVAPEHRWSISYGSNAGQEPHS